jgi:hypothetical protein
MITDSDPNYCVLCLKPVNAHQSTVMFTELHVKCSKSDLFNTGALQGNPKEDIIILIDPDCMFVRYCAKGHLFQNFQYFYRHATLHCLQSLH